MVCNEASDSQKVELFISTQQEGRRHWIAWRKQLRRPTSTIMVDAMRPWRRITSGSFLDMIQMMGLGWFKIPKIVSQPWTQWSSMFTWCKWRMKTSKKSYVRRRGPQSASKRRSMPWEFSLDCPALWEEDPRVYRHRHHPLELWCHFVIKTLLVYELSRVIVCLVKLYLPSCLCLWNWLIWSFHDCWKIVGMSTNPMVKNYKFELMNNLVEVALFCLCCFCFLEQSVFFII